MFDIESMVKVFGESDEGFRTNFNNALAKMKKSESRNHVRRLRLSTALIVVVVCLLFSTVAYAVVNKIFFERVDVGGSWQFLTVPENFYELVGAQSLTTVYSSYDTLEQQPHFDAKTSQILKELLDGKVFTEEGEPFELLTPAPGLFSRDYRADDKGNALYDEYGDEIGLIYYAAAKSESPQRITVWSKDMIEQQMGYNSTYDDAVALLGRGFRLPTVYTDGLESPKFQLTDREGLYKDILAEEEQDFTPFEEKTVSVRYDGSSYMNITIENERNDSNTAMPWHIPGGTIEEREIARTTVYKIISANDGVATVYTWAHDGLIYTLRHFAELPGAFTEEQCEEIIASMIE